MYKCKITTYRKVLFYVLIDFACCEIKVKTLAYVILKFVLNVKNLKLNPGLVKAIVFSSLWFVQGILHA